MDAHWTIRPIQLGIGAEVTEDIGILVWPALQIELRPCEWPVELRETGPASRYSLRICLLWLRYASSAWVEFPPFWRRHSLAA
jgi:hypothetical protein